MNKNVHQKGKLNYSFCVLFDLKVNSNNRSKIKTCAIIIFN